jgi:hypothetical protein
MLYLSGTGIPAPEIQKLPPESANCNTKSRVSYDRISYDRISYDRVRYDRVSYEGPGQFPRVRPGIDELYN